MLFLVGCHKFHIFKTYILTKLQTKYFLKLFTLHMDPGKNAILKFAKFYVYLTARTLK